MVVGEPDTWRRISDPDPRSLAELAADASGLMRAATLRRLGDLCLVLSGVFPEHASAHPLAPHQIDGIHRQLSRVSARPIDGPGEILVAAGEVRGIWLLEWLGQRSYELAMQPPPAGDLPLLGEISPRFRTARRTLNAVAIHRLGGLGERWFPAPAV